MTLSAVRERFERLFIPEPMSGCWLWLGAAGGNNPYGRFNIDGKKHGAHRVSYELYTGAGIPRGFDVHHKCVNPSCVNPRHLQAVPVYMNQRFRHRRLCSTHKLPMRRVSGRRRCRKCHAEHQRAYRARQIAKGLL